MIVNDSSKSGRSSIILAVVLAVAQLALVPNVALLGGRANLALVLVGCACLGGNASKAPLVGFAAGLFFDLAGSGPIGLMALLLTACGYLFASADRSRVADDLGGSVALFVPAAFVVELVYAVVLLATGLSSSFVDAVFLRAIPGVVLDCVSFAIVGLVLSRFQGQGSGMGGGRRGGSHLSMKGL